MSAHESPFVLRVVDVAMQGPLEVQHALDAVADAAFGGIDVFIGRVRAHNHGRVVTGLHYDMFDPLAIAVFARAASKARTEFGPALRCYVAHAKGHLVVGDTAVIVAVATPHRDEAFRACRAVIEVVKHEAPIWKQEHYIDGSSAWTEGCSLCGSEPGAVAAP